jgi:thymidylate synthase (FAD)
MILKYGHESVIEHEFLSVRFVVDRGVSHEIVRHRLVSYSQESTRYCNYQGGVTFVIPTWFAFQDTYGCAGEWDTTDILAHWKVYLHGSPLDKWLLAMARAEDSYLDLLRSGQSPQQARSVLPNSLKTEIVCTANLREWRHILWLRASMAAHPQMREVMVPLLAELKSRIPVVFDDIVALEAVGRKAE